jgi:hypothetical protein
MSRDCHADGMAITENAARPFRYRDVLAFMSIDTGAPFGSAMVPC